MQTTSCTLLVSGACTLAANDEASGPCARDAHRCEAGPQFEFDPSCTSDEMLVVEIGGGSGYFQRLAPGQPLRQYPGPNGFPYIVVGLAIQNPDLEHLSFQSTVTATRATRPDERASRSVVYERRTLTLDNGRAELLDLVLKLTARPHNEPWRIEASIEDTCGRTGTAHHEIDALAP